MGQGLLLLRRRPSTPNHPMDIPLPEGRHHHSPDVYDHERTRPPYRGYRGRLVEEIVVVHLGIYHPYCSAISNDVLSQKIPSEVLSHQRAILRIQQGYQ